MSNVFDIKDIEKHSELKKKINSALDNLTPEEIENYLLPHIPKQAVSRVYNVRCILKDKKGFEKRVKIDEFKPIIKIPVYNGSSDTEFNLKNMQAIIVELEFIFDHWEADLTTDTKDIAVYKEQI